jgi:iron complex outermembrane receptor protein
VRYQLSPSFTSTTYLTSSHSYSQGYGPYFYLLSDSLATGGRVRTPGAHALARADQSTHNSRRQVTEIQQLFNGDFQVGSLRNRVVLGLDFLRIDSNIDFFGGSVDTVRLGGAADSYRNFTAGAVQAAYAKSAPTHYPVTTKVNTYSAFVSDVLNLTNQLSVLAAVRVDRYDNAGGLLYFPAEAYKQTAV